MRLAQSPHHARSVRPPSAERSGGKPLLTHICPIYCNQKRLPFLPKNGSDFGITAYSIWPHGKAMQTESDRHADVGVGRVVVVRVPVVVHVAEVRGIAGVSGEKPPVRAVIKSSLTKRH